MDIEEFYAADERRRRSAELEFGRDWHDENGRCAVSWIEDTGELYLMREPSSGVGRRRSGGIRAGRFRAHARLVSAHGVALGAPRSEAVHERLKAERSRVRMAWPGGSAIAQIACGAPRRHSGKPLRTFNYVLTTNPDAGDAENPEA